MDEYFFYHQVTAQEMDLLWANGWRHFGPYFFRYAQVGKEKLSILPLRIALSQFKRSKSHKRILKKNQDLRLSIEPAFIDERVCALFEKHKKRFSDNVPESIYTFMSSQPDSLPCECKGLYLSLNNKLIAVSFLDCGKSSTSSVYQCFDPKEHKRSLGVLMILLSIQHSLKQGKNFYYPGYGTKEPSHYDYKKKFSSLEGFSWEGQWQSLDKS